MNKSDLISAVAEKSGIQKKDAERAVNAALDTIISELRGGGRVQLTGFGIFEVKDREARVGRNPRTKESVAIPATRTPVFKASKAFKDSI